MLAKVKENLMYSFKKTKYKWNVLNNTCLWTVQTFILYILGYILGKQIFFYKFWFHWSRLTLATKVLITRMIIYSMLEQLFGLSLYARVGSGYINKQGITMKFDIQCFIVYRLIMIKKWRMLRAFGWLTHCYFWLTIYMYNIIRSEHLVIRHVVYSIFISK